MKRRRHKRRRNPVFICKKVGKKLFGGRKGKRYGKRRKSSGKRRGRKMSAGFRKSGNLMKRVWAKHRAALMKLSGKRRFKQAWVFARKMKAA